MSSIVFLVRCRVSVNSTSETSERASFTEVFMLLLPLLAKMAILFPDNKLAWLCRNDCIVVAMCPLPCPWISWSSEGLVSLQAAVVNKPANSISGMKNNFFMSFLFDSGTKICWCWRRNANGITDDFILFTENLLVAAPAAKTSIVIKNKENGFVVPLVYLNLPIYRQSKNYFLKYLLYSPWKPAPWRASSLHIS